MADPSPALQARVEQEMQTLDSHIGQTMLGKWLTVFYRNDVEALVIRLLTEQQRVEAQIQELTKKLARVDERDSSGVLQSSAKTSTGEK